MKPTASAQSQAVAAGVSVMVILLVLITVLVLAGVFGYIKLRRRKSEEPQQGNATKALHMKRRST